jgi:hypothetical protein
LSAALHYFFSGEEESKSYASRLWGHFSLPIAAVLLLSWRIEITLARLHFSEAVWLTDWVGSVRQRRRIFNAESGAQKRT